MARKKEYIEEEVIEKAMNLFWRNGYETTSVRMLEKEMGINQFSMYSSFGNKQGVFLESVKCYKKKAKEALVDKLKQSTNGVEAIKEYFYNFIEFSKDTKTNKGCLLTNTVNELGEHADTVIMSEIIKFATDIKSHIIKKLETDKQKDSETIAKQANYLMVSLQGLSVASKMFEKQQLEDFIESAFESL
ncbi:TetR/AcrR family transcriptional regulator [Flavivirga rizhaonensis]|uniref:TetR/AcrR family transcriptional regulator n=1 Tax=Flavivirga rizhaonensis TaxID=2559571 RepID=A0A4S1E0X5_9FLAO|nr:TetR/AcrR family transcriptional regulator [Flavivirga rizhaonensis]TGV03542.1 TetR/AcrR family transcriptional regulator [Flavivirga rizhaonensis]